MVQPSGLARPSFSYEWFIPVLRQPLNYLETSYPTLPVLQLIC